VNLLEQIQFKEKELRLLRTEVGVAFDSSGRVVLEKAARPNAEYELEFSDEEIAALRTVGAVTFTHNHPRGWGYPTTDPRHAGSSFSLDDVLLACRAELREIRAVTPLCTYSFQPGPGRSWNEATWHTEIRPLQQAVYATVKQRLYTAALRGEVTPAEASARLDHEVWTEVAALLGLRYSRVEE
jgi:hypothetical protein